MYFPEVLSDIEQNQLFVSQMKKDFQSFIDNHLSVYDMIFKIGKISAPDQKYRINCEKGF